MRVGHLQWEQTKFFIDGFEASHENQGCLEV